MNFVRWSFSFPNADFSATTVLVTKNGTPAPLNTLPLSNSFGDNTIVWEFDDFELGAPPVDWNFVVTVNNVMIDGSPQNFNYEVTVIDPEADPPVGEGEGEGETPPSTITLLPSTTFAIEGKEFVLALNVNAITGATWTKDNAPVVITKALDSGGGPTDTSLSMTLALDDAGEYCVTGTLGDDEEVDACYVLNAEDIAPSGSTIPVGGLPTLAVLSILIAFAAAHRLRRRQLP